MVKKQLDHKIVELLNNSNNFTPDFHILRRSNYSVFPVLITGLCKKFNVKNKFLEDSIYFGDYSTYTDEMVMMKLEDKKFDCEPFVLDLSSNLPYDFPTGIDTGDLARIEGELYGVPLRKLTQLDNYFKNGSLFERKQMWIASTSDGDSLKAWVYCVDLDSFNNLAKNKEHTLKFANKYTKHLSSRSKTAYSY